MTKERRADAELDERIESACVSTRWTHPSSRRELLREFALYIRRAALEEAARIAERHTCTGVTMDGPPAVATVIAQRIRALIEKEAR